MKMERIQNQINQIHKGKYDQCLKTNNLNSCINFYALQIQTLYFKSKMQLWTQGEIIFPLEQQGPKIL